MSLQFHDNLFLKNLTGFLYSAKIPVANVILQIFINCRVVLDIWYLIDSVTKIQLGTKVASARCQTWVKWKWPKVRHICKGSFFGMQDKRLKGLITLKLNFTTNPTLLSMGWVNLCPEASIMPDIYQITCCAYNGSWNDESLINMQTYQVGFDRVSTVRKAKNRTLFIIFVLLYC